MNDVKNLVSLLLNRLQKREYSTKECRDFALSKGFDAIEVNAVIDDFIQCNWINDRRFAEMVARTRYNQGKGEQRVKQELNQHQIESDVIESIVMDPLYDWFELAKTVRQKKFTLQPVTDLKIKAKQQRFLVGRGFTFDQIDYALNCHED